MIDRLQKYVIRDFLEEYPDASYRDNRNLRQVMKDVYRLTGRKFIILIDEWDCMFRKYKESAGSKDDIPSQKKYLDFLHLWLKGQIYVGLAYMTGILPIKKYGTHSALDMFIEYSMTDPKSVVESMLFHKFGSYWNKTETYEAWKIYIQMNYDGLKDAIITKLAEGSITINTDTFTNDMTTFSSSDDVLTLLTHLGYLTYDSITSSVSILNKEVNMEYVNSIKKYWLE